MKIILSLVSCLYISTGAFAQTNLIQNPGFESYWSNWTPDYDDAYYCFVASPLTSKLWYFEDPSKNYFKMGNRTSTTMERTCCT